MSNRKKVVVIPGDDAAPEAVFPTIELLRQLNLEIDFELPPYGDDAQRSHGTFFPDETRAAIDTADATLFGAGSNGSTSIVRYLRWGKGTYANVRPARWVPGCQSPLAHPEGIDLIILRENLEDLALGIGGDIEELFPLNLYSPRAECDIRQLHERYGRGKYAVKLITEGGTRRIARYAFELARQRKAEGKRGKVTCGTKHNLIPEPDGLFLEVTNEVAKEYPDIEYESWLIDDFARRLIVEPQTMDVVVLPSLYGDIFSDAAAGLIGGLGLCPSGCYGDDYAYFEPIHGTAPDIAGQNIINPTATIRTAAMMLTHLGYGDSADRLNNALTAVYAAGTCLTPDQGGSAKTDEFCAALAAHL
ncbi:MAG: isocitrate/isopropylmalate dehydrogenase [Gammaproteobacteria bacterium]|jgi:isocitrate/isopropylmalate dehydrogenase